MCYEKITFFFFVVFFASTILAQKNNTYEVYAIEFAKLSAYLHEIDIAINPVVKDSVKVSYMTWLLKGNNGKTVLVDAGFDRRSNFFGNWLQDFIRPDSSLQKIGLKPQDITDVIITHPHRDHINGVDLFPKATIWMQKNDYSYFVTDAWQKGGNTPGLDSSDVLKIVDLNTKGKVQLVNGDDVEIIRGIKVYIGSKHTYESQYAVVNSSTDKVLIASDNNWFYYNLEHLTSIPFTFDPQAYVKNLERMKTLVNPDLIIPGHDSKNFEKFTKVSDAVVRIR